MQQPNPPVLGPAVLALVALVSCLAFVTGSVTVTRSEFTWPADRVGEAMPLVLSAQSPDTLSAQGPCGAAASQEPVDLLSTGDSGAALTVRGQGGSVWMVYSGTQIGQVLSADGPCTVDVQYDRASNTAVLTAGGASTSASVVPPFLGYAAAPYRQFTVTSLSAAPGFGAVLTSQPTTFSSSPWRLVWLLVGLAALAGLALLLRRAPAQGYRIDAPRWTATDTLVGLVGLLGLVVVPPRFDDGWVLTTVRQYSDLGFFSNYYSIDAVAQPQGFWWTWIERLWLTPLGTPGFLLRLPTVLILVGTWWLIRRHVLSRLELDGAAMWAAATVACLGLLGLQITIRPEPVVALLLAAAISVVVRYAFTREPYLLVMLAGLSAFSLAAHQTGWVVVTASAACLPWAWEWLRNSRAWVSALAILVTSSSALVMLLMLGSNAQLWWRSYRSFSADTTTYQSLLDEGDRLAALGTRFESPAVTIFAVAVLILSVVGFLVRTERSDVAGRAAGWAAVAALGGLFLTSSKLVDHYGAVVPAAVVLAALAVRGMARTVAVGAVIALAGIGVAAFFAGGVWALGLDRVTDFDPGVWPVVAGLLALAAAVWGLLSLRTRSAGSVVRSVLGVVGCSAVVLALAPVVVEGVQQPGSWFGQQLGVMQGRTCGLMDVVVMDEAGPTTFDAPDVNEGLLSFEVTPDSSVWTRGTLFSPITVQTESQEGAVTSQTLPPSFDIWAKVQLPQGPATVRTSQVGSAFVVATVPESPASTVASVSRNSWWVEPGLALQVPCMQSVSIKDGTLAAAQYSVGRPGWAGSGLIANSPEAYEAGCAGGEQGARGACVVALPTSGETLPSAVERESVG